jgi:hypothetical protein
MPAGYSRKPLHQKLGIKPGQRVAVIGTPSDYETLIGGPVAGVRYQDRARGKVDIAHCFVTTAATLRAKLPSLMDAIAPDGMIWISWPKRASGVATDLTEDGIRDAALPLGLVDVKVCAVDDTWSGLKLVIRKTNR